MKGLKDRLQWAAAFLTLPLILGVCFSLGAGGVMVVNEMEIPKFITGLVIGFVFESTVVWIVMLRRIV